MSLQNEIINIQINDPLFDSRTDREKISYKVGHRDARHAAAEIALKYERALEDALFEFGQLAEGASDAFIRNWAKQRIKQIKQIFEESD